MERHVHLKITMQCMYTYGIYNVKSENRYLNFFHKMYSKFIMANFVCTLIGQHLETFSTLKSGLFDTASVFGVSLLYTSTAWKTVVCGGLKMLKLIEVIKSTEREMLCWDDRKLKEIYYRHVRWNYFVNRLILWAGIFTIILFYVKPFIEMSNGYVKEYDEYGYEKKPLPLMTWFPFNRHKYYTVAYCSHIIATMIGGGLTVVTDIFFVSLMTFALGQMKMLQYSFKHSNRLASNLVRNFGFSNDEAIKFTIKYLINWHQDIIENMKILDSAMKNLMLFDFVIASLQIAMLGLQIVVTGFGWKQLLVFEYLGAMFIQLFALYWHASEIAVESCAVASAVWESDWVGYSDSVKKSLMLVIMRAQKPLTLNVGDFYIMSNESAVSILRAAYSYVTLIRQMYMRK